MSAGHRAVAVFGATGHTGRFVVAELLRRGIVPVAVARDGQKLAVLWSRDGGVATRVAFVDDPDSLDRAFAGVAAVINCAGPFLETADAATAAALRAGAHYLDVTAEQPSALGIFERFDAPAREAGLVVMPAASFYGGLADLVATAAVGDWGAVDEIRIGIALDSWHPTEGTRITGRRNTARRMVIAGGQLSPLPQPAPETVWDFPDPFRRQDAVELPFSETALIARHLVASEVHTYLNLAPLHDLRDAETPPPEAADESGRSAQTFLLDVIVRRDGRSRRAVARGRDIYAFTAPIVCEAVGRILDGEARGTGALAPGEAFDARTFLQALESSGLALEIEAG